MSIENSFRMAQVLHIQNKDDMSIKKFLKVCELTENYIKNHLNDQVEIIWAIYSLEYISDIYAKRKQFHKALRFKNIQENLLEFLKEKKCDFENMKIKCDTPGLINLFKEISKADISNNDDPVFDQKRIVDKVKDILEEKRQQRVNNIFDKIQQNYKTGFKKSLIDKIINFIANHFKLLIILSFVVTILAIYFASTFNPRKSLSSKLNLPKEMKEQIEELEQFVNKYEKERNRLKEAKNQNPKVEKEL